jgi:hypothetical protein
VRAMSNRTTEERLSYTINQLLDSIDETILEDKKKQLRVRSYLIKALYWLDRYMSEQYFRENKEESKDKSKRVIPKSKSIKRKK